MTLLKTANRKLNSFVYEIDDFVNIFGLIIEGYNKRLPEAERGEKGIIYATAYSDLAQYLTGISEGTLGNKFHNVVVYDIMSRDSGTLSENEFGSPKEVRPRPRQEETYTDSNGTQQVRTYMGKFYDNYVRFDCYAPTSLQANRLIYEVEGIFEIHAPWLESIGFHRVLYEGRLTPTYVGTTNYHCRSFQAYVRTERLWIKDDPAVNEIELNVLIDYGKNLKQ